MIRGYAGTARRELVLSIGPAGPWHATITVEGVQLNKGRHSLVPTDTVFEVAATWTGPPAAGFPPSDRPVQARDVHPVHDHALAVALATRASELFRIGVGQPPDLRELARQLQPTV